MRNYCLVEKNVVTNVVIWDGVSQYDPPGELLLLNPEVGIGWYLSGGVWVPPDPPPIAPEE